MFCHQFHGLGVTALHDLAHRIVDLAGKAIGAVVTGHQITAEKHLLVAGFKGHLAQIAHAKAGHHLAGDGGHLLDVTAGTRGDLGVAKYHIFGGTAPQGTHDPGTQLGPTHQHLLLIGGEPGEALGLATGNQGDLLHRVVGLHQGAHQGMANFVVGDQAFATTIGEGLALHTRDHPIHGVINFRECGGFLAAPGREDGGFVEQVGEIRPREARCAAGNGLQAHIRGQGFIAGVHLEHRQTALDIGHIHLNLAIKAAWTQQG